MTAYKVFQAIFLVGVIIVMIFDAREMIVHDRSLRWTSLVFISSMAMFYLGIYVERKRRKPDQNQS